MLGEGTVINTRHTYPRNYNYYCRKAKLHLPKPLMQTVCCVKEDFDSTHGPFTKGYLVNSNECLMKSSWWAEPGQDQKNLRSKQTILLEVRALGQAQVFLRNTEL